MDQSRGADQLLFFSAFCMPTHNTRAKGNHLSRYTVFTGAFFTQLTVIGKQGHSVLVTLVERKTRFTVAIKAVNKTARAVTDAICDYLKPIRKGFSP